MKPFELAKQCGAVMASPHGLTKVLLVLEGRGAPRGRRVRLVNGRGKCPMGEPVNWSEDRRTVAYFDATEVLAWLAAKGLVGIEWTEAGAVISEVGS